MRRAAPAANARADYTTPAPVAELDTAAGREGAPFVVQSDDYLVFESEGDIFEATR